MDTRQRIIEIAARMLQDAPADTVSMRDIGKAAGVTSPTLYHHFGDRSGLLDAVAAYGFDAYITTKRSLERTADPIGDLARSWDTHVEFGIANPALYALMYGNVQPRTMSPVAQDAQTILTDLLERVADLGRLNLPVDEAAALVGAACVGATLQAIQTGGDQHTSHHLRDTVLGSIIEGYDRSAHQSSAPAEAARLLQRLRHHLPPPEVLKPVEVALLQEWLETLAQAPDATWGDTPTPPEGE